MSGWLSALLAAPDSGFRSPRRGWLRSSLQKKERLAGGQEKLG